MTKTTAFPCKPEMKDCEPASLIALMIMSGASDAPYAGVDQTDGEEPKPEDVAFWDRVNQERDRIASWAIQGLGITGRAQDFVPGE